MATLAAAASSFAAEWQKPIYSGKYKMLEAGSTVYIYNTDAHLFLGEGNDYGTHATMGDRGTYFRVKQHLDENNTWAFVDEVDYIDYEDKLSTYEAAITLGEVVNYR